MRHGISEEINHMLCLAGGAPFGIEDKERENEMSKKGLRSYLLTLAITYHLRRVLS